MLPQWIKNGVKVLWRRGRICDLQRKIIWENEDFQEGILNVTYNDKDFPKAYRNQTPYWKKGDPATIAIEGMIDWAEYTAVNLEENGHLVAEDYVLEIKPL